MNKIEKLYAEARAADDSILADGCYTNENGSTLQGAIWTNEEFEKGYWFSEGGTWQEYQRSHFNNLTLENVRCHLLREIKHELESEDEEFDPYDLEKLTHQYLTLTVDDLSYWKDVWYYCEAICCE
mgnify:CR=1 FL=1|tara:strand:+ start:698 stop:1075 length:378 start_codon:yes stop_codon:yes gene_type:complete